MFAKVEGVQRRLCLQNSRKLCGANVLAVAADIYSTLYPSFNNRVQSHLSSPICRRIKLFLIKRKYFGSYFFKLPKIFSHVYIKVLKIVQILNYVPYVQGDPIYIYLMIWNCYDKSRCWIKSSMAKYHE